MMLSMFLGVPSRKTASYARSRSSRRAHKPTAWVAGQSSWVAGQSSISPWLLYAS